MSQTASPARAMHETRGQLRIYLGCAAGRGQDLRHAQRGPPARERGTEWWSRSSRPTAGSTPRP